MYRHAIWVGVKNNAEERISDTISNACSRHEWYAMIIRQLE